MDVKLMMMMIHGSIPPTLYPKLVNWKVWHLSVHSDIARPAVHPWCWRARGRVSEASVSDILWRALDGCRRCCPCHRSFRLVRLNRLSIAFPSPTNNEISQPATKSLHYIIIMFLLLQILSAWFCNWNDFYWPIENQLMAFSSIIHILF